MPIGGGHLKKWFIFLLFILPVACGAENINCKYNNYFIEEAIPTDSNIHSFEWEKLRDSDSGEYVNILKIVFKNHNAAEIKHKYCDMYNFEYTYSVNKNSNTLSKVDIVKYITEGFKQSELKPKFRINLDKIILQTLNQHGYDAKTPFSIGLPADQIIYNETVEYGIEYMPDKSDPTASTLIFYMSIGGE